jgi:hypothetical protein
MLVTTMKEWGNLGESRKAGDAKKYARIVKEVGKESGVSVLDVWGVFMERAGWKDGDMLPGSMELGLSAVLEGLLDDGEFNYFEFENMGLGL